MTPFVGYLWNRSTGSRKPLGVIVCDSIETARASFRRNHSIGPHCLDVLPADRSPKQSSFRARWIRWQAGKATREDNVVVYRALKDVQIKGQKRRSDSEHPAVTEIVRAV